MKLLVINGPNLNMLGIRERGLYGERSYDQLVEYIHQCCRELGVEEVECFQSNHEGAIVDAIQAAYGVKDAIVINPAAYTHTSVAILDALKAVNLPAVEVHLTDVDSREEFRRISYAGLACQTRFSGLGFAGYRKAIEYLLDLQSSPKLQGEKPMIRLARAEELRRTMYSAWEWNFGASPPCQAFKQRRVEGCGRLEVRMDVEKGRVKALRFFGDFFSLEEPAELAERLTGCPLEAGALRERLAGTDVGRYFRGLDGESLLRILTE